MKKVLLILIAIIGLLEPAFSQTPLPKGATLQTIEYGYQGKFVATGYVHKKQFVEQQQITFSKRFSLDTIISGTYFTENGTAYIEGTRYSSTDQTKSIYKGLFQVCNTSAEKELTTNPKEFRELKIQDIDISYFHQSVYSDNFYKSCIKNVYIEKQTDGTYSLMITGWKTFESQFPEFPGKRLKEQEISNLEENIDSDQQIKLTYSDGDIFVGNKYGGEYIFASGERYIGKFNGSELGGNVNGYSSCYRLIEQLEKLSSSNKTIFADGSETEGDWLKLYNFKSFEKEKIRKCRTLTEARDMAVQIHLENQQKLQKEKQAKESAEQEKQELEQKLTAKYGAAMAKKVMMGTIEIGMSKEICKESLANAYCNDYVRGFRYTVIAQTSKTESWKVTNAKYLNNLQLLMFSGNYHDVVYLNFVNDRLERIIQ